MAESLFDHDLDVTPTLILDLKKYNISPSRYIHTSEAETYRPIAEIVEELKVIEAEARETDKALAKILEQMGI